MRTGMMQSFRQNELKRWIEEYLPSKYITGPPESKDAITDRLVEIFEFIGPPIRMAMRGYNHDNGRFYGTLMHYVTAYDFEMMNAKLLDFFKFLQLALFSKLTWDHSSHSLLPTQRHLTEHVTTFDYLRSTDFEKSVIRASRADPHFIGNRLPYYSKKIEQERNTETEKAATEAAAGGATDDDDADDNLDTSVTKKATKSQTQPSSVSDQGGYDCTYANDGADAKAKHEDAEAT